MKSLIAMLMLLALAGCKEPSSMIEFTQCIRPLDYPNGERLLRDERRNCQALQWRMPKSLFSRKWEAYGATADAFIMRLPPHTGDIYQPTSDLMLMPIIGSPADVLDQQISTTMSTSKLAESPSPSQGLRMLKGRTGKNGDIEMTLVAEPGTGARYKGLCFVPLRMSPDVQRRITCDVRSVVNTGAYAKYTVPIRRIAQLPEIHRSVVEQLSAYTKGR
jgi:hypothetical protein